MTEADQELRQMVNALSSLPKVPHVPTGDETVQCLCGRDVPLSVLTMLDTGVVQARNNVCADCKEGRREDRKLSRIVCVGCRAVVARMVPHKDVDGFVFEADRNYHIERCSVCSEGLTESLLLEKKIWQRRRGIS
jgi:hypothetical protein